MGGLHDPYDQIDKIYESGNELIEFPDVPTLPPTSTFTPTPELTPTPTPTSERGFLNPVIDAGPNPAHSGETVTLMGSSDGGSRAGALANAPDLLLDPAAYVWPFFKGLDIARDMELHQSQQGVVILDGWDGIHPVPVNDMANPVWFARNEDPMNLGNPLQVVGMPYIVLGFDDPTTGSDESDGNSFGIDAESIFTDLEFADACQGLYTLDKFGAVFVLGDVRPLAAR